MAYFHAFKKYIVIDCKREKAKKHVRRFTEITKFDEVHIER